MTTNVFAIISDNGSLRAGNTTRQSLDKLKDNGFEQVNHSEDFLNTLSSGENAFFLPKNKNDIECLYDETNIYSLPCSTVELLLNRYKQQ